MLFPSTHSVSVLLYNVQQDNWLCILQIIQTIYREGVDTYHGIIY